MRYLLCKDRKILGPFKPIELVNIGGFDELSLVCPEGRTGFQPIDWQKAGSAPEIMDLLRGGGRIAGFRPAFPSVEPSVAAGSAEREEEYQRILAALDRRIALLEDELKRKEEASAAKRGSGVPAAELKDSHEALAALHMRIGSLQESLEKNHQVSKEAMAELEDKTQKALKDVTAKVEGLRAPGEEEPVEEPSESPEEPKPDKLHQRILHKTAKSFGVDDLCKEMGDYHAALGGVFTAATGAIGALPAVYGLATTMMRLNTLADWMKFLDGLSHDPHAVALGLSIAAIGTGYHQIGSANNHAALMDSHANLAAQLGTQPSAPKQKTPS